MGLDGPNRRIWIGPPGIALAILLSLAGCGHRNDCPMRTIELGPTPPTTPALLERRANEAAAHERYTAAYKRTGEGWRAYAWSWLPVPVAGRENGWLQLIVAPDGSGELSGSIPRSIAIDAETVKIFEASVRAAGFPRFAEVEPMICTDGGFEYFDAAAGDGKGFIRSNPCGVFVQPLRDALNQLMTLAKANGGLYPPRWTMEPPIQLVAGECVTPGPFRPITGATHRPGENLAAATQPSFAEASKGILLRW